MFANQSPLIHCLIRAADSCCPIISRDFLELEQLQVTRKGQADFVSKTDKRVERLLVKELHKSRPEFGFITEEETVSHLTKDYTFIIDPIDGTSNYIHGVPHFCISIGVMKGDTYFAGLICDPLRGEFFWAESGKGAFLNGKRIKPSGKVNDDELIGAINLHLDSCNADKLTKQLKIAIDKGPSVRITGSAALDYAYTSCGRFDFCLQLNNNLWDLAAGFAILKEAGCIIYSEGISSNNLQHKVSFVAQPNKYEFLKELFVA